MKRRAHPIPVLLLHLAVAGIMAPVPAEAWSVCRITLPRTPSNRPVNDGDVDHDGVPNFADGFDLFGNAGDNAGGTFGAIEVKINRSVDLTVAKIRFTYSASSPAGVTRTGPVNGLYTYTPDSGNLRLWKKNGMQDRLKAAVTNGDFIDSGSAYSPSAIGNGYTFLVYVEGIAPSVSNTITVELAPDGVNWECSNTTACTILKVEIENTAPGRDTDDIQVQHFTNSAGVFTYTAIPLQIYYRLQPDSGWTPDSVELHIKNPAGSTVRTVALPTSTGQQSTNWDGKTVAGDYVPYGSNYVVEIAATIGATTCSATNGLTVYEIREGNCLYRWFYDFLGRYTEHAAILYEYQGGNTYSDLTNSNMYMVAEHGGETLDDTVTRNYGIWTTWLPTPNGDGAYCPSGLSRANRKAILENCYTLVQTNIPYTGFMNVLKWQGDDWDGKLSDIATLRCDGFVEAAYEALPVQLYGAGSWWNIMDAGGGMGTSLDKHNNSTLTTTALTPERQRHTSTGSGTTNVKDALYRPSP